MQKPGTTVQRPMYCRQCNYRLLGLSQNRCPECGRPFDPADHSTFRRYPALSWPKRIGLVLLVAAALAATELGGGGLVLIAVVAAYWWQRSRRRQKRGL